MTLDEEDRSAIADRIVMRLLAHWPTGPAIGPELVGTKEAMTMLNCRSATALHRRRKRLRIAAVTPGQFRRKDIINAVARAALASKA